MSSCKRETCPVLNKAGLANGRQQSGQQSRSNGTACSSTSSRSRNPRYDEAIFTLKAIAGVLVFYGCLVYSLSSPPSNASGYVSA